MKPLIFLMNIGLFFLANTSTLTGMPAPESTPPDSAGVQEDTATQLSEDTLCPKSQDANQNTQHSCVSTPGVIDVKPLASNRSQGVSSPSSTVNPSPLIGNAETQKHENIPCPKSQNATPSCVSTPEVINVEVSASNTNQELPATPSASSTINPSSIAQVPADFTVFPVGLNVGSRSAVANALVRGKEDGSQAINFENWLLPYESVVQALRFTTKVLPDGQVELRSPFAVTRIDLNKLRTDPQLGLVLSIQEIQTLFGIKAEFNITEYAIVFNVPQLDRSSQTNQGTELPVILEGLPRVSAPDVTISAIEQRVNAAGTEATALRSQGELTAVGTVLDSSWFIRLNQPNLTNTQTWSLAEAQIIRQTDSADYFLGSQPTFWRSQGSGDYWGLTTIQRYGFAPQQSFAGGGANPSARLQPSQITQTISGRANPGTLVRLVQGGFGDRVIAEVLVDSSGIYRFDSVPVGAQFGSNYRVLLYPQGQLTAQPEIQDAQFSTLPGQLSAGTSALIVSAGMRRRLQPSISESANQNLLGDFSDFTAGIAQRWGISDSLTLGLGAVYDESLRGYGELFFQPKDFPLQVAVSALTGDRWDVNTDVLFNPSPNFYATLNSDRFSTRYNVNWQAFRGFSLFTRGDTITGTAFGAQYTRASRNSYTFAQLSIDTQSRLNWSLAQGLDAWELNLRGNDIGTFSQLAYNFTPRNALRLTYETQNQNRSDELLSLVWDYRSQAQATDGQSRGQAQLGYGVGSQGSGVIASLGTTVIPGLLLRGRYQGVSLTSNESSFSIDLVSSLNLQRGITPGDRRSDYLRTQGGLLIQPFFDRNGNGKRDAGEEVYIDTPELLIVNNQPIKAFQVEKQRDRLLVRLPPGMYRLDLDPAGLPPDLQAPVDALAVEVVAGSYTPILVPLVTSYTVAGVVTDATGKPINGARVEAISTTSQARVFSITNEAGVYYLERLQQGTYTLQVNGKPVEPNSIKIEGSSQSLQELNLKLP